MGWRAVAAGIALLGCRTDTSGGGGSSDSGSTTSGSTTTTGGSTSGTQDGSSSTGVDPTTGGSSTSRGESSTGEDGCRPEPHAASTSWIANTGDGTVAKIDTDTLVEEARYLTRADAAGDPSHAAVSFDGDVAVANRRGGVVVIAGAPERCPDPSATSSGPEDVHPFPDGCVRWEHAFDYAAQHPVAWTPGAWDDTACAFVDVDLWTSGTDGTAIDVVLLDGDTGTIEQTVPIEGVDPGMYGLFAAAVDARGDFWGVQLTGSLVHVAREDFAVRTYALPITAYGVVVDHDGFVWTCWQDAAVFDPVREAWEVVANVGGAGNCVEDRYGVLWLANDPLVGLGIATRTILYTIDLPSYVRTVAIDASDRVWGIEVLTDPGRAHRIDPVSGELDTFEGLSLPDAHGDPTGLALQLAGARRRP